MCGFCNGRVFWKNVYLYLLFFVLSVLGFCIVPFMYIYSHLFRLYQCKDYCHRVTTESQLVIIIIKTIIIIRISPCFVNRPSPNCTYAAARTSAWLSLSSNKALIRTDGANEQDSGLKNPDHSFIQNLQTRCRPCILVPERMKSTGCEKKKSSSNAVFL